MSLSYYMDEHVLRLRGVDVITAQEDHHRQTDDPLILDRATVLGRVVFTQDQDFLREVHSRQAAGVSFAGVIYAPQLKSKVGQYVNDLEVFAKAGEPADLKDQVIYLRA
jgi:hypothetical protein